MLYRREDGLRFSCESIRNDEMNSTQVSKTAVTGKLFVKQKCGYAERRQSSQKNFSRLR